MQPVSAGAPSRWKAPALWQVALAEKAMAAKDIRLKPPGKRAQECACNQSLNHTTELLKGSHNCCTSFPNMSPTCRWLWLGRPYQQQASPPTPGALPPAHERSSHEPLGSQRDNSAILNVLL